MAGDPRGIRMSEPSGDRRDVPESLAELMSQAQTGLRIAGMLLRQVSDLDDMEALTDLGKKPFGEGMPLFAEAVARAYLLEVLEISTGRA